MRLASFLAIAIALPAAAWAAPAVPSLDVRPTTTPPKIDGVLDDQAWRDAAHSDAFRQVDPEENVPPSERTEVWVTFDADNVYVALRCHDSAGLAGIRAYSMQRDQDNGSDDLVRVVLDTFNRENDGYYFALTAAGGMHDGLIQNKDEANEEWDGLWYGKVTRDAGGWSAEFALPAKSLAFDPANGTWGLDLGRAIRRKQEVIRWANYRRDKPTISLPHLGEIKGMTGLRQGRGLDFKPYARATYLSQPAPGEEEFTFKPGLDLVWHVTPSLAATLTVNTDFADAEVDERQVNLGRFPLFYPEKRTFFTQDAPLFSFAGIQHDPLPFYSRRIGLAGDGTEVALLGGVKLTGRAGPWTVGLLDVQIEDQPGIDSKNLLVGRVARQVLDESSAGVIFTHGDPRHPGDNFLGGADFNFVNSHLPGDRSLTIRTSLQGTESDLTGGTGAAGTLAVLYPNEPFESTLWFSRVGNDYDPALGFVSRTGVQNLHLWNRYRWYYEQRPIRRLDVFAEGDWVTDLHGRRLDRSYWLGFMAESPGGDEFIAFVEPHWEQLDAPFEIQPGIVIPAADYRWNRCFVEVGTTRSRPANVAVEVGTGGFYTGDRTDYEVEFGWRPSNRVELELDWELRQVRLPEGDFDVRIVAARAVYTFTPDLQLSLLGQYDNLSAEAGFNFRAKWTPQPGNDLYFIINQGYDTSDDQFRPVANETTLKGVWTFRF